MGERNLTIDILRMPEVDSLPAFGTQDQICKYQNTLWTWDADSEEWIQISGSAGGGGGAGLTFIDRGDSTVGQDTPEISYLTSLRTGTAQFPLRCIKWKYLPSGQEVLFGIYRVPANHKVGDQIFAKGAKVFANSTDTSKKILINFYSYLVKTGDDALNLAASAYGSNNVQIAITSTANELLEVGNIDLNDSDGQISGRDVSPGDEIWFWMKRDNANESPGVEVDVYMPVDGNNNPFTSVGKL